MLFTETNVVQIVDDRVMCTHLIHYKVKKKKKFSKMTSSKRYLFSPLYFILLYVYGCN